MFGPIAIVDPSRKSRRKSRALESTNAVNAGKQSASLPSLLEPNVSAKILCPARCCRQTETGYATGPARSLTGCAWRVGGKKAVFARTATGQESVRFSVLKIRKTSLAIFFSSVAARLNSGWSREHPCMSIYNILMWTEKWLSEPSALGSLSGRDLVRSSLSLLLRRNNLKILRRHAASPET